MRRLLLGCITALGLVTATAAQAQTQSATFGCGGTNPTAPTISPNLTRTGADRTDLGFACMMWQNFVALNWPALAGQRGVPDTSAKFGGPGATVWETYKTSDQTFLPGARNPGPWEAPLLMATLEQGLAARVASGAVRHLTQTSKVSRAVLANIARNKALSATILDEITQAGGGTLYDLAGNPVYYQVAMNRDQYQFIVQNGLYNANTQAGFAQKQAFSLPSGRTQYGDFGAIELKAAWKVLSDSEAASGRFHTIEALIGGSKTPVKVGLVGFHLFIPDGAQGVWATFAQIDNAPVVKQATSGTFNFFNPNCKLPGSGASCPVNMKDADPGQVLQVFPDNPSVGGLNTYMQGLIRSYDAGTAWQYYKIVDVQWALSPQLLARLKVPLTAPLPLGSPNHPNVVNAVLETFLQKPTVGCLSCHANATVAASSIRSISAATSYSFMFGGASVPAP